MFERLTLDEGVVYADFRLAYDDVLLTDLAWLMRRSGGPVEKLDYSLPSLDELHRWAIVFVGDGLPGVAVDAVPIEWVVFSNVFGPEGLPAYLAGWDRRREYFDELVEAYERATLFAYFPDAVFRPWDGIALRNNGPRPFVYVGEKSYECMGRSGLVDLAHLGGLERWLNPNMMSERMLETFPDLATRPRHGSGSVLADRFAELPLPRDDARRIPPFFGWRPAPTPVPSQVPVWQARASSGFEPRPLYIARMRRGSGDEEDPRLPMAPEPFIAALTSLGYRTFDGDAPTAEAVRAGECGFRHPEDETIVVQTEARDGELIDLLLQPLSPTRGAWRRMLRQMRGAAKKVGARIAEEEDWD